MIVTLGLHLVAVIDFQLCYFLQERIRTNREEEEHVTPICASSLGRILNGTKNGISSHVQAPKRKADTYKCILKV